MVEKRALIDCSIVSEDEAKHIRGLTIRREREIAEADRHRKSQIRNINQHYEFELSRAEVRFSDDLQLWRSRHKHETLQQSISEEENSSVAPQVVRVVPAATANLVRYSASGDVTALQLGDQSISEDIFEASRDFINVARNFSDSVPEETNVVVMADTCQISIGTETFVVGEMVKCLSSLSQEVFHGMISSITEISILIICGNSARFLLPVGRIRDGRVTLSSDTEIIQSAEIVKKHRSVL